jgi:hypothetical protein
MDISSDEYDAAVMYCAIKFPRSNNETQSGVNNIQIPYKSMTKVESLYELVRHFNKFMKKFRVDLLKDAN